MSYEAAARRIHDRVELDVSEIRKGDQFVGDDGFTHWTAVADAGLIEEGPTYGGMSGGVIVVDVQFVDGGLGERAWDPGTRVKILRKKQR